MMLKQHIEQTGNPSLPDDLSMPTLAIQLPQPALQDFCHRWKIRELAIFGSALRDDFGPESDIDLLATFDDNARWSLLDMIQAEEEAAQLLGRPVDLVERSAIENSQNWIRKNQILRTATTIYGP